MNRATVVGALGPQILVLVGCAPAPESSPPTPVATPIVTATPTVLDSGPVDAVTAAFTIAEAGGMPAQVDFLACVAGGEDAAMFGTLFGGLAELALVLSGVEPDAYWTAIGLGFDDFSATETERTGDQATVNVQMTMSIEPDTAALRELMQANLPDPDPELDDARVDAIIGRLINFQELPRSIDHDVTVTRSAGTWSVCGA
jgi:hypothetical protein